MGVLKSVLEGLLSIKRLGEGGGGGGWHCLICRSG